MMTNQPVQGPQVVILAYDGLCTFEFGLAVEIFALPRPEMGTDWYRCAVVSLESGPLRAQGGLLVSPTADAGLMAQADLLVVPGWRGIDVPVPADVVAAVKAVVARGGRVMSICSGVAVLAATGLLDGRRATTHWRHFDRLAALYPHIALVPDVLYVDADPLFTSAGSAAGLDLCLYMVRRDYGVAAANRVAERLVVPPHRDGGQRQRVTRAVPPAHRAARFAPLFDHLRQTLDQPHGIDGLAARVAMSRASFLRHFKAATGLSVGDWLTRERVALARDLLESSDVSLEDIARRCGFASASSLRDHFRRATGMAPTHYRAGHKR